MRITFFSSSEFILPLIKEIKSCEGKSLVEVFETQYLNLRQLIKEHNLIEAELLYPQGFFDTSHSFLNYVKCLNIPETKSRITLEQIISTSEKINRGKIVVNPVLEYCRQSDIPFFAPIKLNSTFTELKETYLNKTDFAILASYGQIISDEILNLPKYGFINWHPSLLPKYRGASPIQSVILHNETKTGLTWLNMVKAMDAGDIWLQLPFNLQPTSSSLNIENIAIQLGLQTWSLPLIMKIIHLTLAN